MSPLARRGATWRTTGAIVGLALSTVLVGGVVGDLVRMFPPERFGAFDAPEVAKISSIACIVWALGHVFAASFFLSGTRDRGESADLAFRTSVATLLLVLSLWLPLQSWDLAHGLARGRFLLLAHVPLVSVLLVLGFRARTPPDSRPDSRRASLLGILERLAGGALALVLLAEAAIDVALLRDLRHVPDSGSAGDVLACLVFNFAVAFALASLAFVLARRVLFSVLVTGMLYGLLVISDVLKLAALKAPLAVLDVYYLVELRRILTDFVSPWKIAVGVGGVLLGVTVLVLVFRREAPRRERYARTAALAVFGLLAAVSLVHAHRLERRPAGAWDPRTTSLQRGLLVDVIVGALELRVERPPGYSDLEVVRILDERTRPPAWVEPATGWPNLVVVVVESLMDPRDFPFRLDEDPLSCLRSLEEEGRRGRFLSPSFGSQSSSTEFELLTGMSMAFLPAGAMPYRQYVWRDLPSLPRLLGKLGHRVKAVIVDPREYFDRPISYPRLGLDDVDWLDDRRGVERDVTGRYPSDDAVIDAILAMDDGATPFFAFAFTNATHAPYDPAPHGDSAVAVLDAPNERVARDLGGYASSLRVLDRAIERLVAHFRASPRPTLVVVHGDHLPPYGGPDGVYEASDFFAGTPFDALRRRHSVPVWMWANYEIERAGFETSANHLGSLALEAMGIELDPFLQVVGDVREPFPVFSALVVDPGDGTLRRTNPVRDRRDPAVRDYELLQYDLLSGGAYYYETVGR